MSTTRRSTSACERACHSTKAPNQAGCARVRRGRSVLPRSFRRATFRPIRVCAGQAGSPAGSGRPSSRKANGAELLRATGGPWARCYPIPKGICESSCARRCTARSLPGSETPKCGRICTTKCGSNTMVLSRRGTRSYSKTGTAAIARSRTWSASLGPNWLAATECGIAIRASLPRRFS